MDEDQGHNINKTDLKEITTIKEEAKQQQEEKQQQDTKKRKRKEGNDQLNGKIENTETETTVKKRKQLSTSTSEGKEAALDEGKVRISIQNNGLAEDSQNFFEAKDKMEEKVEDVIPLTSDIRSNENDKEKQQLKKKGNNKNQKRIITTNN